MKGCKIFQHVIRIIFLFPITFIDYVTDDIDVQIINDTRLEGEIRVSRTVSYVVEDFD